MNEDYVRTLQRGYQTTVAAEGRVSTVTLTEAEQVEARLWEALRRVEDPEIPVSVVGMGLIVSLAYRSRAARARTCRSRSPSMGCPAMEFIEDDIRDALLRTPTSTRSISRSSGIRSGPRTACATTRAQTMRRLGIAA